MLLSPHEPPAWSITAPDAPAPVLLVCDHASNRIPARLGDLGLPPEAMGLHIAWDLGAAGVTRALSERLGAAAVYCGYSRLVVDCNRSPDHETLIAAWADGYEVSGNRDLDDAARSARLEGIHRPYHAAIEDALSGLIRRGPPPALISVHSFTPSLDGRSRPWHVGVLWDQDPRMPVPLMDALTRRGDVVVGDNQPYSGGLHWDFTVDHHAVDRGLPHVILEVRQDLITEPEGQRRWADILADALEPILADQGLYRAEART